MDNCVFCKIISGELPSHTIYEDNYFKVIMDAAPATFGHALILPKVHAADLFELTDEYAERLIPLARHVAKTLTDVTGAAGINLLQNNGAAAGQAVFHFHLHLVPRYPDDGLRAWAPMRERPGQAELAEIAENSASRMRHE